MKKSILIGALALVTLSMHSCSDILDQEPMDSYTDAAIWGDLTMAETFLNTCYRFIEGDNQSGVMFCNYTDETYHMHDYGTSTYTLGRVSCDNSGMGWTSNKWSYWNWFYSGVKRCNMFLERIEEVPANTADEQEMKEQMIGQCYFLRAFYYHYLYSLVGRVPIIDHTFNLDSEYTETRASLDEVADFILGDLDKAISKLPIYYADDNDFGRATKGAAMALKGRVLLYKASPLFGTPSREKWQTAATALKQVIDLDEYYLQSVSNSEEYAALFCNKYNPEVIFEKLYDKKSLSGSSASLYHQAPAGPGNGFEGWSTWQPTYNIVNLFQNADGTEYIPAPTHEEVIFRGTDWEETVEASEVNPWENRELRLEANIFHDGSMWGYKNDHRAIEIFVQGDAGVVPGKDSYQGECWWNGTKTGYNMRKFLNANHDYYDEENADTTPWFLIRLSEVYLNYAECMIELGNNVEALKYINLVRNRALLPDAKGLDIRKEYEYERTVELMFEGQRFFDLRRWKKMEEAYSPENWPTAMTVYKMSDGRTLYSHSLTPLQQRNFLPQMYWWPVPRSEMQKNPNLDGAPYE